MGKLHDYFKKMEVIQMTLQVNDRIYSSYFSLEDILPEAPELLTFGKPISTVKHT